MADTQIKIGLSPEEVVASLKIMADEAKKLQGVLDDALGKKGSQSINDLKDNAEKGTNQITKFFSNMGTRIREDLKTAFDVSSIMAGANFAKQLGEGVKQVMDMEKAFSRLNVRMGLSAQQMDAFKRSAGRATSEAGINIKDVTPGLMAAASRGGVKDPKEMTAIAASLAQSRQINPDLDTGAMTDDVAEILKRQHIKMTGATFASAMDAINGATAQGGFSSSSDAARTIAGISPYAQQLGLDTRGMAGLAAVSSKAGDSGENVLMQLLKQGTGVDRGARLNALFGAQVFKNGKLDASQLANVNTNQFGQVSQQVLEQTTGISGASGSDLKMFIDTWKENMGNFDAVVKGSNETATQFGVATDNFASKIDMFKQRVTQAGQEIGDSVMEMAKGVGMGALTKGGMAQIGHGAGDLYDAVADHGADLAGAGALTLGAGLLMGGGVRGLIGSAAASATGTQKVYVTNAAEISGGGAGGLLGGAVGMLGRAGGYLKTLGGASVGDILAGNLAGSAGGAMLAAGAGVLGAGAAGVGIGMGVNKLTGNDKGDLGSMLADTSLGKKYADFMYGHNESANNNGTDLKSQISDGMLDALQKHNAGRPKIMTQPSSVKGR